MTGPDLYNKISDGTESASVELSEADFCDPSKRQEAMARLTQSISGEERRVLVRPKISVLRTLLNVFIPIAVCTGIFCALYYALDATYALSTGLGVSLGALFIYTVLRLRGICIWSIKMYQRFAPDETRLRCVFSPSCSEYAILALQKYGVVRGLPKIISRLKRCHPPNGGEDPLE